VHRSRVRGVLIVVVMASLGAIGFVLGRTLVQQKEAEKALPTQDLLPEVSQRIRDFRRVKVSDGHKVWELTAKEAQYFEDKNEVVVTGPEVAFYGDGDTVRLVGREGRVRLDGRELERLDVDGGVTVEVGDYRLETDQAVYYRDKESIIAPKGIRVAGNDVDMTGDVLVVDLGSQKIHVVGNVTTEFTRAALEPDQAGPPEPVSLAEHQNRTTGEQRVATP
jgi:LPS export ABC transporter protein LptC